MKRKIELRDNIEGKVIVKEVNVRDEGHLLGCIKYPSMVFKNKKKYNRKNKYKNNDYEG